MKKLLFFLALSFCLVGSAHADLFDYERSKEVGIRFSTNSHTSFSGATTFILIDKSDTSTLRHKETGHINIRSIFYQLDKAAASTTTVRIGVINFVNTSTGSVTWLTGLSGTNNVSNTNSVFHQVFEGRGLNTRVTPSSTIDTDGSVSETYSNEATSGSAGIQNDQLLPTISGTSVLPSVGDVVVEFIKGGTAINYRLDVRYYSMP